MERETLSRNYRGRLIGRRTFLQWGGAVGATALLMATGCTPTPKAADSAEQPAIAYEPGTYTAEAPGKKSMVRMKMTFSDSAIIDVKLTDHHETERIADAAINALGKEIVDLQSLNVDTVTGATVTSMAMLAAITDCVDQAGGDVSALESGPSAEKSTDVEEIEADLIVVGAGASGLPIAVTAAQAGKRVVVFEKNAFMGGNMLISDGRLFVPLDGIPAEARKEMTEPLKRYFFASLEAAREAGTSDETIEKIRSDWDAWYAAGNTTAFDSKEYFINCTSVGSEAGYTCGLMATQWFYEELGVKLDVPVIGIAGLQYPRSTRPADSPCGAGFIDGIENYIAEKSLNQIEFLFSTPATELIVDNGAVVGVEGACEDGTTYRVRATSGVVLATGGYGASKEWLERLAPSWGFDAIEAVPTVDGKGIVGDGLALGESVGAALAALDYTMLIPYAHPTAYILDHVIGDTTNPLVVNLNGVRFMDETASRNDMTMKLMEQPEQKCFVIASAQNSCIGPNGRNFGGEMVDHLLDFGLVYKADTLEELAEVAGLPVDALLQTVEKYNEQCAKQETDEFGRFYFETTAPIADGPYYASPCTWATLITFGGLAVDETFSVLDETGNRIPGLFAMGEVAGAGTLSSSGYALAFARQLFSA